MLAISRVYLKLLSTILRSVIALGPGLHSHNGLQVLERKFAKGVIVYTACKQKEKRGGVHKKKVWSPY